MKPLSPAAAIFVHELRRATGKTQAIRGAVLAQRLKLYGARAVRDLLANEWETITKALHPAVLMSGPPDGYWLSDNTEEIEAKHRRLCAAEKRTREAKRQFVQAVHAAGLGGILRTRAA